MNLPLKKSDLKGPLSLGGGWLISTSWATRTGTDNRLATLDTINAAFSGLDVAEAPAAALDTVSSLAECGDPFGHAETFHRTSVLVEGEDEAMTRVYRTLHDETVCVAVDALRVLGDPVFLKATPHLHVYACPAGLVACTTDVCPPWAAGLGK